METIIRLDKVGKSFGKMDDHWAIEDIDLEITQGQIFGIIGSSGAGKSTLLRCINLLEYPSTGKVWVNGMQLNSLSPKALNQARKKIGMIFQHFNLLSSKTVLENVALPLKLIQTNKSARHEIARKLLQLVGLSDKEKAYPSQLSGGQKQRVAIARALILEPSVLLCDEATSALDPESTFSILQLLQSINRQLGITIVLITHEMQVIRQICQQVAVLSQGKIVEIGAVPDVFGQPQSEVTKRLLSFSEIKLN